MIPFDTGLGLMWLLASAVWLIRIVRNARIQQAQTNQNDFNDYKDEWRKLP